MIENFGKGFWYAPGVMLAVSVVVSLVSLAGPTEVPVKYIMALLNGIGTDDHQVFLSHFVGLYVLTSVTIGLILTAFQFAGGLQSNLARSKAGFIGKPASDAKQIIA